MPSSCELVQVQGMGVKKTWKQLGLGQSGQFFIEGNRFTILLQSRLCDDETALPLTIGLR